MFAVSGFQSTVVALVAEGQTTEGILALYPDLEADDVREALLFAREQTQLLSSSASRTVPMESET